MCSLTFTTLKPLCLWVHCAKFGWDWSSDSGEDVENVKVHGQTNGRTDRPTTDKMWSENLPRVFSSGELKGSFITLNIWCHYTCSQFLLENTLYMYKNQHLSKGNIFFKQMLKGSLKVALRSLEDNDFKPPLSHL